MINHHACLNLSWLEQVGELASALRSSREEVAAQVAAANAKDRENSQLWEQVRICSPGLTSYKGSLVHRLFDAVTSLAAIFSVFRLWLPDSLPMQQGQ